MIYKLPEQINKEAFYYKNRNTFEIKTLKNKAQAKVFYITTTDISGQIPKEFDYYTKLIKKEIKNLDIKHHSYPNRSKGKTYTYEIFENENSSMVSQLYPVKR